MKKMKKCIVACAVFATLFVLSACGGDRAVVQGKNNPDGGTFVVDDIQGSPAYYVGTITLIGIVGNSSTQDFSLQNKAGTFEVLVDYRGSQVLPQVGTEIVATGVLRENRPCCGPGFTLTSTSFEAVSN